MSETPAFEIGVMTLGEHIPDAATGQRIPAQQRLQEIIDAARLADEMGLDVFGVGEHHSLDFAVSAVPVVLAAIAQVTQRIRLTSTVTILSTADPVREFENYATLDLLSGGRAEMIAGRGAFTESFALFGYDMNDYDRLFPEALDLMMKLNASERVTWRGQFRAPLDNAEISPRPLQDQIPVWIGVGGTPESAIRAGTLGLPMVIGIIGGPWTRFAPFMTLYRQAGVQAGHDMATLKTGVTSYMHIGKTSQEAIDEFYPYHMHYFAELGGKRGRRMELSRPDYERTTGPDGAYFVGSTQQVIDKIMAEHEVFGHQRFMAQIDIGGQPYSKVAQQIELLATEVAPVVRREIAKRNAVSAD
jgi:probable LLM family oxidoreductase